MRVVERAKTLQIAPWLHHLDMVVEGDELTPQTLEVSQHRRGPLLDLFLAPMMSSLTFAEVVDHVLDENRCREESLLAELQGTVLRSGESWTTSLRPTERSPISSLGRGLKGRST